MSIPLQGAAAQRRRQAESARSTFLTATAAAMRPTFLKLAFALLVGMVASHAQAEGELPEAAPAAASAPAGEAGKPGKAASYCSKMANPEVPVIRWVGDARFTLLAEVKDGKVRDIQYTEIKTSRAIQATALLGLMGSIEVALRQGYECPGDHVFKQEFLFRIS
ncbi:hypothetical protein [Paucibacter soli]|uniref:hypothetical protein n=1 Tax=Paucibacter soli TaxID=3133433 RepID=UPI0030A17B8B